MLLNLIVVGVFVTVSTLVVGGAARMDSEVQISIGKSGEEHEIPSLGKHISYSSSFGDEDFSGPDIPASFDRLYGINSSFHANKSHLTSESLELEAVFPSSSSSSEDEDKVNNTRKKLKDDKKEKLKQNRKTRKKDPDTAVKEEKPKRRKKTEKEDSTAKEQKPKRRRKTTKKNDSENVTKPKRTRKPRVKSKMEATSTAISTTLTSAKTSIKATENTTPSTDGFVPTTIITPTEKVMTRISTTEIITSKPSTTTTKRQTTTESLTTEKPTLTTTTSLSSTHKPITTKKPIIIKEEKIYPGKTVYKVSSSFTHGAVLPTTTKPSLLHSTIAEHFIKTVTGLQTLDSTTTMLPVMHATEEPIEVKQHTTEDHIQVTTREAGRVVEHPIWEILRETTTTTTTNLPEPNIPRLNIRRRKKMPLRFKPPPEGWPGINPSGDPDEFKVVEPEYTFPPNQPTVKNNFWDNKVAVTMSLAQELAKKYQVLTRKPYVPFVHSRQKDRVYSYRNASGYFIYVRERPTYFPTKPTVPYKPTFKFVYQQQPRRFDWRSSTAHRPGPGFVVSNITTSYAYPLNASMQTVPPRYPIPPHLPRQPYYTPGAYYMYPKQGSDPPPGPPPYQAGPYPPRYPPPPYPPGQPIFPSGQSYQPPHPPFPLPRQPPLGAVPPPPALGPPPPARPPYPPRAPYPPPPYQNAPYPHGPPQPPPPPPYARNPYQPSPYQPKPMYQPVYRPPYPPPPASQPFKARVPYGDDVGYEDDYDDRNYIEEQPMYTGPVKGYPLPSPRIRQPRPYYQERPRTLFNLTHGGTKPISLTSKLPAFLARTMFPYIPRGTLLPPGVRHTMLPPSAWRRNKTFTYQDAFNRGFGRIRPISYGKRVSSFGHVPVNELGPPPPKMGEGYAVNLTSLSRNTSHARRIFGYEPYRPKPKLNIYKGGFGYEPYRGPPSGKKPKGPDYVPYRPFKSKIDRLSLKEYVPYKPFRKDKDKDDRLPMRFDKSRRFSGTPRPTRSYTYPPRRDFKKTSFRKEASVPRSGKEPEVKTGLAAYLSEAQLKRMGKGKSLADMFADFFPSTEKSGTNKPAKVTTFSRKSPSLDKSQENVFDDSEALEALANTMVIKEKPTPKPKGMTAREAMRAAAREAAREMEMEDEEQGIYSRKHFNMGGGRPPPFVRRGGARGGGRGGGRGGRRGGEMFRDGGMQGRGKKKHKKGKNRERRSVKDEEKEDLVPIGDNRYIWSSQSLLPNRANYRRNHPIDDPSPVRHQLRRGKGRPMVVYIQPRQRTHIR